MEGYADTAADQHGLVRRTQLKELGLGADAISWRLHKGALSVAAPGVYRVKEVPTTWLQRVAAATLWADGLGVASHRSAAALWDLDGFPEASVEISADKQLRVKKRRFRVYRRAVPERLVTTVKGIRVTTAPRTLADLAPILDAARFGRTVEDMLRRGFTSPDALRDYVQAEGGRGTRGVGILRTWLADGELSGAMMNEDAAATLNEDDDAFDDLLGDGPPDAKDPAQFTRESFLAGLVQ